MGIKCTNCGWWFATPSNCPNCGDKDPEGCMSAISLVFKILGIIILFYSICLAYVLSPLIISVYGLAVKKTKRFGLGIGSVLAFICLLVDMKLKKLTAYIVYGYTDNEGIFQKGILGDEYVNLMYLSWVIGLLFSAVGVR